MNVAIFTLDDRVYLPAAVAILADSLGARITCIVAFPPPRRGGSLASAARWAGFLGVRGTRILGWRWLRNQAALGGERHRRSIAVVGARHGIAVYAVARAGSPDTLAILERHPADVLVSLSCPQLIGRTIRERFPAGAINVHSAPLPRYRGQMPAFWVLARGEAKTAVTVHEIDDALDSGDILLQREIPIEPGASWDSLLRRTKVAGAHAVLEVLRQIEAGTVERRPNSDGEATRFGFPTWRDARAFRARGGRMA